MRFKKLLLLGGLVAAAFAGTAQVQAMAFTDYSFKGSINLNNGGTNAITHPSLAFQIGGTNKATRPWPVLTTAQRNAIASPQAFATIANTTTGTVQVYNGSAWVDIGSVGAAVSSVFSRTGTVTAQSGDYNTSQVTESGNLYFTNTRARAAISLTTSGSGAASYNTLTGGLNIPTPSIPTDNASLTNGANYITTSGARSALSLTTTGSGAATYNSSTGIFNIPTPATQISSLSLTTSGVLYSSPVTFSNTSGAWTGALSLASQTANTVLAAPNGSSGTPSFRPLVQADAPTLATINANLNAQTSTTYTLQASDNGKVVTLSNASAITLTVPSGLGAGFNCLVVQLGAGQVTFTASSTTVTNRQSFTKTAGQNAIATIVAVASNTFITSGDMQ